MRRLFIFNHGLRRREETTRSWLLRQRIQLPGSMQLVRSSSLHYWNAHSSSLANDCSAAHSKDCTTLHDDPYSMIAQSGSQSSEHGMPITTSSPLPLTLGLQTGKFIHAPIIPSLDLLANITHDQRSPGMLQSTTSAFLGKSSIRRSYECPLCHAGEQDGMKHSDKNDADITNTKAGLGQDINRSAKLKNVWTSPTRFQAHIRASHINLFQINSPEGFVCWLCPCTGRTCCPARIAKESELINHLALMHSDRSGKHRYNCHLCYSFLPIPDTREAPAAYNRMIR